MDIQLADVTIHVDQKVDSKTRSEIETTLRYRRSCQRTKRSQGIASVSGGIQSRENKFYDLLSAVKGVMGMQSWSGFEIQPVC